MAAVLAVTAVALAASTLTGERWHASHACDATASPPAAASERSASEGGRTSHTPPSPAMLLCLAIAVAVEEGGTPRSWASAVGALESSSRRLRTHASGELSAEPATSSSDALPLPPPPLLPLLPPLLLLLPVLLKLPLRRIAPVEKMSFSIEVYSGGEADWSGPPPHMQNPSDSSRAAGGAASKAAHQQACASSARSVCGDERRSHATPPMGRGAISIVTMCERAWCASQRLPEPWHPDVLRRRSSSTASTGNYI